MSLSNPVDTALIDPLPLAQRLIACPSVTPATGAVFDALEEMLIPLGFAVDRFVAEGSADGPVENLIALRPNGSGRQIGRASCRERV